MKDQYSKGNIVVCLGGTQGTDSDFSPSFSVCKVVEVGYSDLVVQDYPEKSFSKLEIVPKTSCIKIEAPIKRIVSSKQLFPSLGDLVYSLSPTKFNNSEPFSGILYSIEYKFGKPKSCKVLCGEKFKEALYENLMVLHTDREQ